MTTRKAMASGRKPEASGGEITKKTTALIVPRIETPYNPPPTSDDPYGRAYDCARAAGDDDAAAAAWPAYLADYTRRNRLVIPATGPQEAALESLQRFLKRAAIEAIKAELGIEGPGIYGLSSQDARRLIDAATAAKKQLIETWRKARAGMGER